MRRVRRIRPTWRGVGLAVGAVVLAVAGPYLQAEPLAWFAMTIGAFLLVVAGWVAWEVVQDLRIQLERTLTPAQLQAGRGALTEVHWPPGSAPRLLTTLSEVSRPVHPRRRGPITLGPALIHRSDPFGLFRWSVVGRRPDGFIVWPRTDAVDARVFHRITALAAGSRGAATSGLDDLTLREYQHGDPLSRVYWKRRTPGGALLVRVDEPSRNPQIDLVLIPGTPAHTDAAVDVLASAVTALCTPERDVRLLSPAGVTAGDRPALLTALAVAEPGPATLPVELPTDIAIIALASLDRQIAERVISWVAASAIEAESVFIFPPAGSHDDAGRLLGAFTLVAS